MSVAIIVTKPIFSIADIDLTRAFFLAIRLIPKTKITDIATGKPSGAADTVRAIINLNDSLKSAPLYKFSSNTTKAIDIITAIKTVISLSIFCCTGLSILALPAKAAKRPNSVLLPVDTTTALTLPDITKLPLKIMFVCSYNCLSDCNGKVCLLTGSDSPVSKDSSTLELSVCKTLASAGTF